MRVCVDCAAIWPDQLAKGWGTNKESSGYGPRPRCVNVVPTGPHGDGQVCGGELVFTPEAETAALVDEIEASAGGKELAAARGIAVNREPRKLTPLL